MAIGFVDSSSAASGSSATSLAVSKPAAVTSAHLMVVAVAVQAPSNTDNPITAPSGWVLRADAHDPAAPGVRLNFYTGKTDDVGAGPWTFSVPTATAIAIALCGYSGVDLTTPVVGSTGSNAGEANAVGQSTSSTSRVTPSIVTAGFRWIVSAFADRSTSTYTVTDTERLDILAVSTSLCLADSNASIASGTLSRTATASAASSTAVQAILALNPASDGGVALQRTVTRVLSTHIG